MSHLEAAKALVAEHIAASQQVHDLLTQLTTDSGATTQAAVAAATGDLSAANDTLTLQIDASLAQLRELAAQLGGVAPTTEASPAKVL